MDSLFISIVPHTVMLHTKREEMERTRRTSPTGSSARPRSRTSRSSSRSTPARCTTCFAEALEEGGVPTYTTAERAMTALNRLVDFKLGKQG